MPTDPLDEPRRYGSVVLFLRDAGVALLFVVIILLSMFAFTGQWPPLVVVESKSMMHNNDSTSDLGVIDTGDLVLVQKVDDPSDIKTYIDGFATGYRTYGDYGDVVVYKNKGSETSTPIIHRAIIYLEYNADDFSYRSESLRNIPSYKWTTSDKNDTWNHLTSQLVIYYVSYTSLTVTIDIPYVRALTASDSHGVPQNAFITKGDNNPTIDQLSSAFSPVQMQWIVGKARGEIPWFGLLKLWSTHSLQSEAPSNSVRDLWISIALIVVSPVFVDIVLTIRERRAISRNKLREAREALRIRRMEEIVEDDETSSEEKARRRY